MLIALTGADGVGKSTVSKLLLQEVAHHGKRFKTLDRWNMLDTSLFPQSRFISAPLPEVKQCVAEMEGPSRFLFILWTIYGVLESYDPASPHITFIDSYWMKHPAAEVAYGLPEKFVLNIIELLPKPDLTILLDLSPELAYERKEKSGFADLNYYECGMDKTRSYNSFIQHQSKIRSQLLCWADSNKWHKIDTSRPVEEVAAAVSGLAIEHFFDTKSH